MSQKRARLSISEDRDIYSDAELLLQTGPKAFYDISASRTRSRSLSFSSTGYLVPRQPNINIPIPQLSSPSDYLKSLLVIPPGRPETNPSTHTQGSLNFASPHLKTSIPKIRPTSVIKTTDSRPYKCKFKGCLKAFHRSEHLTRHSHVHQGTRPYKCNITHCSKSFGSEDELRAHLIKHERKAASISTKPHIPSHIPLNSLVLSAPVVHRSTPSPALQFSVTPAFFHSPPLFDQISPDTFSLNSSSLMKLSQAADELGLNSEFSHLEEDEPSLAKGVTRKSPVIHVN